MQSFSLKRLNCYKILLWLEWPAVIQYPWLNGLKSLAWDTCAPHTSVQLHNGGFFNHCMTKWCLHNSINVLFNNWMLYEDGSNENFHVMNKIGFLMNRKLVRANCVLWCNCCRLHRYVAAPTHYLKRSVRAKYFTLYFLYFLFFQLRNLFLGRGN
jgi:hypothetical protein